ncbi:MAG: inositol monophosphatase family protein [Thermoleophilia bacterium]
MESRFGRTLSVVERAWLECFIAVGAAGKEAAGPLAGTDAGRRILGRGEGGDATLVLDERAEAAMLSTLNERAPEPFGVVSEEAGVLPGPSGAPLVLIDPVDGSLNAKRGLPPFCAALALIRGKTLSEVRLGFVADYTRQRWYAAVRGAGLAACLSPEGVPVGEGATSPAGSSVGEGATSPEGLTSGLVEVLLLEAGRSHGHGFSYRSLADLAGPDAGSEMRVRQIGSLALCLCHLAGGVADVLFAPVSSRSVDIAGGLLMVAESGGGVASLDGSDLLSQPPDLERRAPFVAWRVGIDGERVTATARALAR